MPSSRTHTLLAAAVLLGAGWPTAWANTLYKCTDPRGQVVYSDKDCRSSEPPAAAPTKSTAGFNNAAVKGKLSEAAISGILRHAVDLGVRGDYKAQCALAAPDITFSITDNSTQPATTISGKRRELCDAQQRTSAQTLEFNSLRPSVQQTGVQIKVSADGTQATAKHTHTTTFKQHGQVVLVQTCQQEDAFGIYDGKILYNNVKAVCKQRS